MQALLSFEQTPPFAAPFRFFVTAPFFPILAGILLLWSGPGLMASRWTPSALALTHLFTTGFMMQVMLGAMVQVLPVVAGANMAQSLWVARIVHVAITVGALMLVLAFLNYNTFSFIVAAACFGLGAFVFIGAAAHALYGIPSTTPTIRSLKLALLGLGVTIGLGMLLAVSLGISLSLPVMQLTDIHIVWGLLAWGGILLAAIAYVVVPMFQLTPSYPNWFSRSYAYAALSSAVLWTWVNLLESRQLSTLLGGILIVIACMFSLVTLRIQRKSKRAKFDATQLYWRAAMLSILAACILWFAASSILPLGEWQGWSLLFGVLLLVGGFMSVIIGMLYKIVPFLVWLHLQNKGRGKLMAPNMKKVLSEQQMRWQMLAHFAAFALLVLAVLWPELFVYPAGLVLIVANAWLLRNLLSAAGVYRRYRFKIEALLAEQP